MKLLKAWAAPMAMGVLVGASQIWIGWWALVAVLGFTLGYIDPWDSRGEPR